MNEILIPNANLYAARRQIEARPEFPAEVWADWEAEKREQFEGRWPTVEKILAAFEEFGIYLLDVSPGNIAFEE